MACSFVVLVVPSNADAATSYPNCAALNRVYPAGVAHPDARIAKRPGWVWQRVSGKRVAYRPSKIGAAIYNANKSRDGDKDKVACET